MFTLSPKKELEAFATFSIRYLRKAVQFYHNNNTNKIETIRNQN